MPRPPDPLARSRALAAAQLCSYAESREIGILLLLILEHVRWRPSILSGICVPWWGVVAVCNQ